MTKILDLFSGAGGFSYGFLTTFSGKHVAVEFDPLPINTYSFNFPHSYVLQKDVSYLHANEIIQHFGTAPDIIIASPPCEEFSLANPTSEAPAIERIYGTGSARLLLDTIRLIGDLSPRVFVIENVAALMQNGGKSIAMSEFERVGIEEVHFNLIRSHQHGNPSKRLRLFISNIKLNLPRKKPPTVQEAIGDLPPLGRDAIFSCREPIPNHEINTVSEEKLKQIRKTSFGKGVKHFKASRGKTRPNWVRLHPDKCATSVIGLSRYVHPFEDRLLTVREHARLMSYPDDFIFIGPQQSQYNQVGESVPPLISRLIAEEVKQHLEQ